MSIDMLLKMTGSEGLDGTNSAAKYSRDQVNERERCKARSDYALTVVVKKIGGFALINLVA